MRDRESRTPLGKREIIARVIPGPVYLAVSVPLFAAAALSLAHGSTLHSV